MNSKNKILLVYVYTTFAIDLVLMSLVTIFNLSLYFLDVTQEIIARASITSMIWYLLSGIPLFNLIILFIVKIISKVSYKREIIIGLIIALLQVVVFFISLSFAGYV